MSEKIPTQQDRRECVKSILVIMLNEEFHSPTDQPYFPWPLMYKRLTCHLKELGRIAATQQWQPIETVPEDVEVLIGGWQGSEWKQSTATNTNNNWRLSEIGSWAADAIPSFDITHWMPIPLPPTP